MTFGKQFLQFALSLDAINEAQLVQLCRIIERYTQQTLGIDSTKIYRETRSGGRPGLIRKNLRGLVIENVESLKNEKGVYSGQSALSYDRKKPLWIVSKEGQQALESSKACADLWSMLRNIPTYRSQKEDIDAEDPVKTSIYVPLRKRQSGRVFGVVNFRTRTYLETTEEAKSELTSLAEALSILLRTFESYSVLGEGTQRAIGDMELRLEQPLPSLTKPKVFVASSGRADSEVIDGILRVLKEHAKLVDFVFWQRMDAPGNIMLQLMEVIGRCRYGIAYFSEETEDGSYIDNRNVAFEAGMFHGRASVHAGTAVPWIAIREEDSAKPFFDIAQERILGVPRNKDGGFEASRFEAALSSRLKAMIASAET